MPDFDAVHHEIPMRWADLDSLNHVNNVVYLDYAAESRALLLEDGLVAGDEDIVAMEVRFLRPLLLSRTPVVVVSGTDADALVQRVTVGRDESATTFAEVTTRWGEPEPAEPRRDVATLPVPVRRSDLDDSGAVRPTKVFELLQESRVLAISTRLKAMTPGSFVVGTCAVTLRQPIRWRAEPYVASVWVSRVGRASFEVQCQIASEDSVLVDSRTVLVGFDKTTQTSRAFGEDERSQLQELVSPAS